MPLKVIVNGNSSTPDLDIKTIKVDGIADIKTINVDGVIDMQPISMNHGDLYYTKRDIDRLLTDKENKILMVFLEEETGVVDEQVLEYICNNISTRIIHDSKIYNIYTNVGEELVYSTLDINNQIINTISINKVTGNYSTHNNLLTKVISHTTAEWEAMPNYITSPNQIYVYTDKYNYTKDGNVIVVPGVKVGSGIYLIDEPFLNQDVYDILNTHITNENLHVSNAERIRWNNKLNYEEPINDMLILTRD